MWHVCAIALIPLALAGCTKTPRAGAGGVSPPPQRVTADSAPTPAPAPSALPAGPVGSPAPGRSPTVAVAQEQPRTPPAPPAPPAAARLSSDVTSLLPLGRESRTLPEDFKIGVLADSQTGDADQRQAIAAMESFLGGLAAGKVDANLIAPSTAGRISDMLEFGLKRGDVPRTFRVGAPKKHESGEISASVRLFSEVGTSEGEISTARTGSHWLVDDVQISLDDLQVRKEKPKERFFPSSYRWMLQE